ncbi:tetratricopeptide repeat protein [Algoriphagus sp.]|uniref:tetratricopeptide repeat protein n=1 Tax=Algoriphagus sp. TaxID=1872435 RepID=UPI0039198408
MNNYRPEISQEEFEEIENYLLKNLSLAQQEDFEKRMESDSVLREEVILQQKLLTAVELGSFAKGVKDVKPSEAKIRKIYNNKVWVVAAVFVGVVLFSFLGYLFLRETNSTELDLYSAYFYADPGLPVVMSSSENYEFYDGMVSYKEGNYEEAIAIWSLLPDLKLNSDTLRYYLGVAHMNLNQFEEAADYLGWVTSDPQSEFQTKAIWYRALINIRQNEINQAIELLEVLLPETRAEELLKKLKKSP